MIIDKFGNALTPIHKSVQLKKEPNLIEDLKMFLEQDHIYFQQNWEYVLTCIKPLNNQFDVLYELKAQVYAHIYKCAWIELLEHGNFLNVNNIIEAAPPFYGGDDIEELWSYYVERSHICNKILRHPDLIQYKEVLKKVADIKAVTG